MDIELETLPLSELLIGHGNLRSILVMEPLLLNFSNRNFQGRTPAFVVKDPEFLKHIFIKDHPNFMSRNVRRYFF